MKHARHRFFRNCDCCIKKCIMNRSGVECAPPHYFETLKCNAERHHLKSRINAERHYHVYTGEYYRKRIDWKE